MNLNEDLGEVVSLAHDLGHPPFGHNGEKALNISMENFGGFNHNDQTLRVITKIEKRHPEYDGLNLTWESLEGIVKHNGVISNNVPFHINSYNKLHNLFLNKNPHLESQIAAIADDVAYNNHDVEDALRAGLINLQSLSKVMYFQEIINELKERYPDIENNLLTYQMLRMSISKMIKDIIKNSKNNISRLNIKTNNDVFNQPNFLISMSDNMKIDSLKISKFLYKNVYNHPKLIKKRTNAENIILKLFEYFDKNFHQLPNDWLSKKNIQNKYRIICDYISGMTDRYASNLYKSFYD